MCSLDPGAGVDGLPLQQQSEWHPGRRNGPRQNHPDHRPHHLPDGAQEAQWSLSHHRPSLVSTPQPVSIMAPVAQCLDTP